MWLAFFFLFFLKVNNYIYINRSVPNERLSMTLRLTETNAVFNLKIFRLINLLKSASGVRRRLRRSVSKIQDSIQYEGESEREVGNGGGFTHDCDTHFSLQ